MTLADRVVQRFREAGFEVSPRGDVALKAFCWHVGKAERTVRNTLSVPGKWPRSHLVGGSRRFAIDAILEWELQRHDREAA